MSQPSLLYPVLRSIAESISYIMDNQSVSNISKGINAAVIYADLYETYVEWTTLRFIEFCPPRNYVLHRRSKIKYHYPVIGDTINLISAYAHYAFDSTKLFLRMLLYIVELAIILNDGPLWTKVYNFTTLGTRAYRFVKTNEVRDFTSNINLLQSYELCPELLRNIFTTIGITKGLLSNINDQVKTQRKSFTPNRRVVFGRKEPSPRVKTAPNTNTQNKSGILSFEDNGKTDTTIFANTRRRLMRRLPPGPDDT